MNSDQQLLIQRLCGTVELRETDEKLNKAVYLDRNYAGEEELSKRAICKFFNINYKEGNIKTLYCYIN